MALSSGKQIEFRKLVQKIGAMKRHEIVWKLDKVREDFVKANFDRK